MTNAAPDHMTQSHRSASFYQRLKHLLKNRFIFLFLLPFFFVLHGYITNYEAVDAKDAFLLVIVYTFACFVLALIGWFFYRDLRKACLFAFLLMAFHFFFGAVQDTLKDIAPGSVVFQYRFLLPASCLLLALLIIWLKKRAKPLFTLPAYLNVLLAILIVIDLWRLADRAIRTQKAIAALNDEPFSICDTCKKPDVYFILLDQYAGNEALKEVFDFDNTPFENELNRRGFYIASRSNSNYNLTPFSMASTLDMNYLRPEMGTIDRLNVNYSYSIIRNARAIRFLKAHGYQFYNHSVFDFPGQPAYKYRAFFPYGTDLITRQTFLGRLKRDIRADILRGKLRFKRIQEKLFYEQLHFNDDILTLTKETGLKKSGQPKFVYAHLMLPHWPYYFDSKGRPVSTDKLRGFDQTNAQDYIEYLQYGNGKILALVDDILKGSANPPVIILLSDHGFRHPEKKADYKYDFSNLSAVYLPGKNYSQFTDSMTNVNFFRIFFNTSFNQHFPILKDSTINLWH